MNTLQTILVGYLLAQAEPLKLPKEIIGKPDTRIEVQAETMGKFVRWRMQAGGPILIDDLPDLKTAKKCLVYGCKPGRYRLECWTAINDEPSAIYCCDVVIEGVVPPIPPTPIPPTPPVPPPVDLLAARLQAAYDADTGNAGLKKAQAMQMIGLYQAMELHAADMTIKSTADLLSDYKTTAESLLIKDVLVGPRQIIAAEVAAVLGSEPMVLHEVMRARAVTLFKRLATSMQAVK